MNEHAFVTAQIALNFNTFALVIEVEVVLSTTKFDSKLQHNFAICQNLNFILCSKL